MSHEAIDLGKAQRTVLQDCLADVESRHVAVAGRAVADRYDPDPSADRSS